jgi:Spy/CpxP family protein refolding chaperone
MNKRWVPIAAAVTLFCATMVSAQPAAGTPHGRGGRGAVLANYLQLTPDQITAWKQLRKDEATEIKPLAQNARDLRQQLDAAMNATPPDPATVGKLSLELRSLHEQIRTAREASTAKFAATLTPEQKVKFDAFQAALKTMGQGRRSGPPA